MTDQAAVRIARPADVPALAQVLADAFADDPVMRFLVPDGHRYRERLARLFRADLRSMVRLRATWVATAHDGRVAGVGVWAPPNRWKLSPVEGARMALPALWALGRNVVRATRAYATFDRVHPARPAHWYLSTLGTAPSHQGTGVGGRLLRAVLDRCDEEGLGAYLESSKLENVPYYARFGFQARGEVHLPDGGPTIVPMWRDPVPRSP